MHKDDVFERLNLLQSTRPIQRGTVKDWDDLEKFWHHIFYKMMKLQPEEHPILCMEPVLSNLKDREKMTQIMFETFNVRSLFISLQSVLALYANGRTTGCVLECGDGLSNSASIYEGYVVPHSMRTLDLAGNDITVRLRNLL